MSSKFKYVVSDIGPLRSNIPLPVNLSNEAKLEVAKFAHMKYHGESFRVAMTEINRMRRGLDFAKFMSEMDSEFIEQMSAAAGQELQRGT